MDRRWWPALLLVLLPGLSGVALANGGPFGASLGGAGGVLAPAGSMPVGVVREQLTLDLRAGALISATYLLENQSDQALDVPVAFAVPTYHLDVDSPPLQAWVDGQPLTVARPKAEVVLDDAEDAVLPHWLDAFTGQAYKPGWMGREPRTVFFTFTVSFAPRQQRSLKVEYFPSTGVDNTRFFKGKVERWDYPAAPGPALGLLRGVAGGSAGAGAAAHPR
ncbi:MAG TPA: hypothetical protein VGK74_10145 [Symbiobacteriaceae bacterium]